VSTIDSSQLCLIVSHEHYNSSEIPEAEKITVLALIGYIAKVSFYSFYSVVVGRGERK
jgi:hypothetical protein